MHRKMIEKVVTFTGGERQSCLFHIVEHLREKSEVIAADTVIEIIKAAQYPDKSSKRKDQQNSY